jgi:hypothetical protein
MMFNPEMPSDTEEIPTDVPSTEEESVRESEDELDLSAVTDDELIKEFQKRGLSLDDQEAPPPSAGFSMEKQRVP